MSERENLTKVKVKQSQETYLNFATLAIQEFCDDIELDMNDVNTMLHACAETVESKFGVKLQRKENLTKTNNQSGKLILKGKLKQREEKCQYLAK